MKSQSRLRLWLAAFCLMGVSWCAPSHGQDELPQFNLPQQIPGLDGGPAMVGEGEPVVSLKAKYKLAKGSNVGRVEATVTIAPLWQIYSVTQPDGGPIRSQLKILGADGAKIDAVPHPDSSPKVKRDDSIFPGVPMEVHEGAVVWTAPIVVPRGFDPAKTKLQLEYDGLACKESCIPQNAKADLTFDGYYEAPKTSRKYAGKNVHASIKGSASPRVVSPGGKVQISLTATAEPKWHVYKYSAKALTNEEKAKAAYLPTYIAVQAPHGWKVGTATTDAKLVEHDNGAGSKLEYYEGAVKWDLPVTVPADAVPGKYTLTGVIQYQTCLDTRCDPPHNASFQFYVNVMAANGRGAEDALAFAEDDFGAAEKILLASSSKSKGSDPPAPETKGEADILDGSFEIKDPVANLPFWRIFLIALAGGLILNVMPCVLPVIGLKIMSFVNQAGERPGRVLLLNVVYSLGLLSVFMVLATLAVAIGYSWGEQNSNTTFNIVMASIVFVMGLSFIGVWEIPIPGFVGSGKAANLSEKEGLAGAFIKGGITTILAVPCAGPFLGTALAWCLGKPTLIVYATFATLALGMALPYLIIGAFPKLMRFLPKPGMWMETFKQMMGFLLLGTVAWILSFTDSWYIVPTLGFLIALWAACWWIGGLPITFTASQKVRHWAGALFVPALVGMLAFTKVKDEFQLRFDRKVSSEVTRMQLEGPAEVAGVNPEHELDWQPFSRAKLNEELAKGKTVMVDFTADWCPNCKVLEATVLNTAAIKDVVEANQVTVMLADYTKKPPEIKKTIQQFNSNSIPLLIIFPGKDPTRPIVLRDTYSKKTLISKLQEAGPSLPDLASEKEQKNAVSAVWPAYSPTALERELTKNKSVLVNFTADWDPSLKVPEVTVLRTPEVFQAMRKYQVAVLEADYSTQSPGIKKAMAMFGVDTVPFVAIVPVNDPTHPIVLRAQFSKDLLISKLQEAAGRQARP